MSQTTSYLFNSVIGQNGQLADSAFKLADSLAAEGAIGFGLGLTRGTAANQCAPIDTAGQVFLGLSLFSQNQQQAFNPNVTSGTQSSTPATYYDTDTVSVLRQGRLYATVDAAVTVDQDVFIDVATAKPTKYPSTNVLSFDADFVASNTINGSINSTAITQITYATSHAATFAALVAEIEDTIESDLGIAATEYELTSNATTRVITIKSAIDLTLTSFAVTNGATQAGTDVAKTANVATGGIFKTSAAAAALAVVEINLP